MNPFFRRKFSESYPLENGKKTPKIFLCHVFKTPEGLRKSLSLVTGMGITLFCAGLLYVQVPFFDHVENNLLDYRFKMRGPLPVPENIVIAAIDEKSLARLGRWPWDRNVMAGLVEKLGEADAALIVWDVFFTEPEKNDAILAEALYQAGNALLPLVMDFEHSPKPLSSPIPPLSALTSIENSSAFSHYPPILAKRLLMPMDMLMEDARGLGHINMFPDKDGSLRWEALIIAHDGYLYPALSLRAAAEYLQVPLEKIRVEATRSIQLGERTIPTDPWGRTLINYYGPGRSFPHVSIVDILENQTDKKKLSGSIVLIGATAAGIYDLRVTPYSAAMPGVEKHASLIASFLEDQPLQKAPFTLNLALLLGSGLLLTLAITRFRAIETSSPLALGFLLALGATGHAAFTGYGLWLNLTLPFLNTLLIYSGVTALHYGVEEKNARRIRAMFSSYVTERVVNELIQHPEMAKLGGIRREVTVLFSDVRGFTSFSEKHSPEEVVSILNEYLGEMTRAVFRHEGTLDKFIGDAVMVFWNAPMLQPDHAALGVYCALDMVERLERLQQKWKKEGKPLLDCGIGLNTGEVLVGNIGAEGQKMDYTIIGDQVNLGARLESLTKKYQARILISDETLKRIRPFMEEGRFPGLVVRGRERVIVKGKEKPVTLYEVSQEKNASAAQIIPCSRNDVVKMTEK
ncbi:adenylate cyclase [Desulfobotulus alkaliphilus]|uniref:Adenylate cyclase n=1 Tax=Desulfobotulus alkaliphilus TaxID=622671 RepID=A0A562RIG5_9BACT|nr:adenylate/guanylate cyclase domain-containing protein [Desulfobotulus alkaliphilus]TWI68110.1 adenylate cyclase [Desulfobotulus alkaliphilus]